MREIYPNVILTYDNSFHSIKFYKSLRFSTHCNYIFNDFPVKYRNFNSPHVKFDVKSNSYDLKIFFRDKRFYFNDFSSFTSYEKIFKTTSHKCNSFLKFIKSCEFIKNANGCFEYLCSLDNNGFPIHHKIDFNSLLVILKIKNIFPSLAKTLTFNFNYKNNALIEVTIEINKVNDSWELYRLFGINVPLLLIQVFLGRNISTLFFIDRKDVIDVTGTFKINVLNKNTYWFDLDETLICQNQPVKDIIKLLLSLISNGFKVSIITRHENNDIHKTLKSIDLDPQVFEDIIHVKSNELKSSYIGYNDFFIDNEFPQRLDVRTRSHSLVLDLDQLDFIQEL